MRKGEKNPKVERDAKPEMRLGQEPLGAAWEKTTTSSGNGIKTLQTKPKRNNSISHKKTRYDPTVVREFLSANTLTFESLYSDIADHNTRLNAIACLKRNNSLQ
jgi:hypothetical protein